MTQRIYRVQDLFHGTTEQFRDCFFTSTDHDEILDCVSQVAPGAKVEWSDDGEKTWHSRDEVTFTDGPIQPGTMVKRQDTYVEWDTEADYTPEYGRVIHSWLNEQNIWDCYVAFFGSNMPNSNAPLEQKPYVLQYYCSSLIVIK